MNWLVDLLTRSRETDREPVSEPSTPTETEPEPEPEPTLPTSPLVETRYGGEPLEITVHRTENVPSGSAVTVAEHIYEAFADQFENVRVEWEFVPKRPPKEKVRGPTPGWWRNHSLGEDEGDANLLLVNDGPIGGTYGNRSVVGVEPIDGYRTHQWQRAGSVGGAINAAIHEVGHCLGVGHDMDSKIPGPQHTGVGWNEDGTWHRTPMVAGNDTTNHCGKPIPKREHQDVVHVHRLAPCFVASYRKTPK